MIKKTLLSTLFLLILPASLANAQYGFGSFADLAESLMPTVVNISTVQQNESIAQEYSANEQKTALGSGFIIDESGYIITNLHVIENAQSINVVLFDNTQVEAEIIGADQQTDIALIKITPPYKLTRAVFGNSNSIRIGDWVLAVGNPFGLGSSVSAGIISAKSRDIASGPYDNFIQTDASINQGSSGGPLFNMQGEVIGINTVIFSSTGASMGIGFAIPINLAGWIVSQLEESGKVNHGWIGTTTQTNTTTIIGSSNKGTIVSSIIENSPADLAGIEVGDIILSIGEEEVITDKDFSTTIAQTPIGEDIILLIWRNEELISTSLKVAGTPQAPKLNQINTPHIGSNIITDNLGIRLREIDDNIINLFNLSPTTMGLFVESVEANSDAAQKGLRKGDVILKISNRDTITIDSAIEYIKEAKLEELKQLDLLIQRQETGTINNISINWKNHD